MHSYIVDKLKEVIWNRFKIDFNSVEKEDYDMSFFSPVFGFSAASMLYLFFDIEKEFDIKIPEIEIENNAFSSFNSIVGIIERELYH